jgi:antitoxin ParD1/3/4
LIVRPAEKLSITLPAEMARMVREKVAGGAYASNSEVIREALRAWHERELMKGERLEKIREKIAEAVDDPRPSLTAKEVSNRLKTLHQKTVKAHRRGT